MNLIKIKNICFSKALLQKQKGKPHPRHISNKQFASRIHKELKLNNNKNIQYKMDKRFQNFIKEK